MGDSGLAAPRSEAVHYVTVENTAYCVASRGPARLRLTYEVKTLRDGVESWFLIAMEELRSVSTAILA
jgi:hypothetical protein